MIAKFKLSESDSESSEYDEEPQDTEDEKLTVSIDDEDDKY